jgi:hypothetical protein
MYINIHIYIHIYIYMYIHAYLSMYISGLILNKTCMLSPIFSLTQLIMEGRGPQVELVDTNSLVILLIVIKIYEFIYIYT